MKMRWCATVLTLCLVSGAAGCAKENTEDYQTEAEKKIAAEKEKEVSEGSEKQAKLNVIEPAAYSDVSGLDIEEGAYFSVIGKESGGEYWEYVKAGAEKAVEDINEELGYKGKDALKVVYSGPATAGDVDEQVNILDEELARYPIGLSIALVDAKAGNVQFDLAAGNGIPVVAFDSASDYQGLMATVSTDNKGTAGMVAGKLAELMNETGEVLVFIQDSKSMSAKERENGFLDMMKSAYPNITIGDVYYMDKLDETKELIAEEQDLENIEGITDEEALDYIFEKHSNVKGCFAADAATVIDVTHALTRSLREDVAVVGYDGSQEEIEALESGEVDGLMVQNPYGMGYASIVASARAALSIGNEAYINTGAMWVTKENLDDQEVVDWLSLPKK